MEVCSAVSGETLAFLDPEEFEGKSAKSVKQCLAAKFGVNRFRQKLLEGSDGSEISEDEVFAEASVKVQLVILDCWPPGEEDRQLISVSTENDIVEHQGIRIRAASDVPEFGASPSLLHPPLSSQCG